MTGEVTNGEEDRLVFLACLREGILTPGIPIHRIVGVEEKIWTLRVNQAVRVSGGSLIRLNTLSGPRRVGRPVRGLFRITGSPGRESHDNDAEQEQVSRVCSPDSPFNFGEVGFVPLAMCVTAGARLCLHAIGNRDGAIATGTTASCGSVGIISFVRRRVFGRIHHLRSLSECGRTVPAAKPCRAGSRRGCVDPAIWSASRRMACETEFPSGTRYRRSFRCDWSVLRMARRRNHKWFPPDPFHLTFNDWFSGSRGGNAG